MDVHHSRETRKTQADVTVAWRSAAITFPSPEGRRSMHTASGFSQFWYHVQTNEEEAEGMQD